MMQTLPSKRDGPLNLAAMLFGWRKLLNHHQLLLALLLKRALHAVITVPVDAD
jgi:hypothetical protein